MFVSYSQVTVFNPALRDPSNYWSSRHVKQGFSWRPGSASFKTLSESGIHSVEVESASYAAYDLTDGAIRVIEVPFTVEGTAVEVGGISDTRIVAGEPGQYSLRVHAYPIKDISTPYIKLSFLRGLQVPAFRLLKIDAELLLTARPARA